MKHIFIRPATVGVFTSPEVQESAEVGDLVAAYLQDMSTLQATQAWFRVLAVEHRAYSVAPVSTGGIAFPDSLRLRACFVSDLRRETAA
jgi:hypothetical protein